MQNVTAILNAIEKSDPLAAAQLLPLVYDELRKLAAARMADEAAGNGHHGRIEEATWVKADESPISPPPARASRAWRTRCRSARSPTTAA